MRIVLLRSFAEPIRMTLAVAGLAMTPRRARATGDEDEPDEESDAHLYAAPRQRSYDSASEPRGGAACRSAAARPDLPGPPLRRLGDGR